METDEIVKALDTFGELYFGKGDFNWHTKELHNGQLGTFERDPGPYDDDWIFHPYENQEEAKMFWNAILMMKAWLADRYGISEGQRKIGLYESYKKDLEKDFIK
jgi:hypothetical protein